MTTPNLLEVRQLSIRFRTDNGNEILDVHNLRIADPSALESEIGLLVGVVEVGLFARRGADVLLVAGVQDGDAGVLEGVLAVTGKRGGLR